MLKYVTVYIFLSKFYIIKALKKIITVVGKTHIERAGYFLSRLRRKEILKEFTISPRNT